MEYDVRVEETVIYSVLVEVKSDEDISEAVYDKLEEMYSSVDEVDRICVPSSEIRFCKLVGTEEE